MEEDFLQITKKELFYTAVMLRLRQLVNVVYDFPADDTKFEQELNEARNSLRKKKLLTESARSGISLDFALIICAAFCANPESCEVVNVNNYYATIYKVAQAYMLMEQRSDGNLLAVWFSQRDTLDKYIHSKTSVGNTEKEIEDNGRA